MKIAIELFSWFNQESICPDFRALNATIFVHSKPKTIICKQYWVWRLQISYLDDLSTSSYVLMLERWILAFSYIQRSTVLLEWVLSLKIANMLFSWFKHEFICPDVRVLNATIFIQSLPKSIIGKGNCGWRLQMSHLADLSTNSYVLMLERWMLPFLYIQRTRLLLERIIVYEDCKWCN